MKGITVEEIIEVHHFVIDEFGGHPGIRDKQALQTAIDSVSYPVLRQKMQSVVHTSAQLLRLIILNHPFVDGNKGTALGICVNYLKRNGFELKAKKSEVENFVFDIAKGKMTELDEIEYWLFQRMTKRRH